MQKFKVDIERDCYESYHSGEEFGEWRESYNNEFKGITMDDSIEYPDVSSSLKFKTGDTVYVVWVEYSYGDSFGGANCAGTETVAVFKDAESAYVLKRAIETQNTSKGDWDNRYQLDVTTPDGQKFKFSTISWHDYFGGLDEVHVEEAIIE